MSKKQDWKGNFKKGVLYLLLASNLASFNPAEGKSFGFNNYKSSEREVASNSIDELVEFRSPDDLFLKLSNYEFNDYALDWNNKFIRNNIDSFVETKMPKYEKIVDEVYQKIGVPKFQNWGTMLNENNGHPTRVSYAGARGLMQILPSTYAEKRDRISYDMKKVKELVSESELDSILHRDFVDYFVGDWSKWDFKSVVKQTTSAKEGTSEFRSKELDWYVHRLPVALMVMREYDDKFPGKGSNVNRVLDNPELNLQINNIIKWDDLLRALSYDCVLQEKTFGKYSVLESNLPPEAIPYSYIAGPGRTLDLLEGAYKKFGKAVSPEIVSNYFRNNMLKGTKSYVRNVLGASNYFRERDEYLVRSTLDFQPLPKSVMLLPRNDYLKESSNSLF